MINEVDVLGHIFYLFLFVGMLLLQSKDYLGWVYRFVGEAGWIGIGFYLGMSSICVWGFAFLVVDVLGYYKWQRDATVDELGTAPDVAQEYLQKLQILKEDHERIEKEQFEYWSTKFDKEVKKNDAKKPNQKTKRNTTKQRKAEGSKIPARNSKANNRQVRPRRGRRSK